MAQAYSDDLRQKLIEAHQQGDGSLPVLAQRFHVSVGWARKVSAAFYRSGSWARPSSGPRGPRRFQSFFSISSKLTTRPNLSLSS